MMTLIWIQKFVLFKFNQIKGGAILDEKQKIVTEEENRIKKEKEEAERK